MDVAINACFGGFGLSPEAIYWLKERGFQGIEVYQVDKYFSEPKDSDSPLGFKRAIADWRKYKASGDAGFFLHVFSPDEKEVWSYDRDYSFRNDPLLIQCIRELGEKANGSCADLEIVEIPDGVKFVIEEYDGNEHIAEEHRTWR